MGFLLAVLSFVVAEDIVELETVGISAGDTYSCSRWTSSGSAKCEASPYCKWYAGPGANPTYKCYDDPCLKLMKTADDRCENVLMDGGGVSTTVFCAETAVSFKTNWERSDCGDDSETAVNLCVQASTATPPVPLKPTVYNYCVYAQLRDGTCPESVCREYDHEATDNKVSKHCLANNVSSGCNVLSESDCKLVPKCYYKSNKCETDPCYTPESAISGTCENYHPGGDASITCKSFKPYKKGGAGSVDTYCVISANSNPNLCYLGTPGTDPASADDYTKTYPTLVINTATGVSQLKPTCAVTGNSCDDMGNCTLVLNKKGGLAGAYCSDGTHGAANILHVPSLFVVLLIALVSLFNF